MKKWVPWIIVAIVALWVVSGLRPRESGEFHIHEFAQLPVLLNGRIQPMDSVARNTLLQIRNKQSVPVTNSTPMSAIEWLLETTSKPELSDTRRIFRVDNKELVGMLKLADTNHFSFAELNPSLNELRKQAQRIDAPDKPIPPQSRTAFEKEVMEVFNAMTLYLRLKNSLQPEGLENFSAEVENYGRTIVPGVAAVRAREAGQEFDQQAFEKILEHLGHYELMSRFALPLVVPPTVPGKSADAWENIGTSLMESARSGEIHPAVLQYAKIITAYRAGDAKAFNQAVSDYRQWLAQRMEKPVKKAKAEQLFNNFEPFYKAMIIYVAAFLLACVYWFNLSPWLRRSALGLVILAFVIHTCGLIYRMVLEGRPPVTNLYSSAIFIGWAAVVLGIVLERFYKDAIGIVTASCVGFVTLVIAHNLALGGDTMIMLQAVLDTNFWLATHVVTVTLGYASTFVAGFLAILYIVLGVFTPLLTPAKARALSRMVYGIVCFATLFSFVGTVLGGIWADQSWGRFWGWDPKENGALLIVIWNAIFLHARWGKLLPERFLMAMPVFGNIVTSFSWFGVNLLGVGLHAYGFMERGWFYLYAFDITQLVIIALAFVPLSYWRSFRTQTATKDPSPLPAPAVPTTSAAPSRS